MSYSACDYMDDINRALKVDVDSEDVRESAGAALDEIERLQAFENKSWLLVVHNHEELFDLIDWLKDHPSDDEMNEEDLPIAMRVRLEAWLLRLSGSQSDTSFPCFAAVPPALAQLLGMVIDDWTEVEASHNEDFMTVLIEQEG
jgi:hypothetical protein